MYVSGVVSGSMLTFIVRGPASIGVPAPLFQDSASVVVYVVDKPRTSVLRLDRQEAAGVVLEVVDAQDDDLVLVTRIDAPPLRRDRRRARPLAPLLGLDVGLTLDEAVPPGVLVLDRRPHLVAGGLERIELSASPKTWTVTLPLALWRDSGR